jgi:hypothetical protein
MFDLAAVRSVCCQVVGGFRRDARGALWTTAYVVCFTLVLSFIFFEVLDVDGSDFAQPVRAAATIKVTEPPQDLRRAPLQTPTPLPPLVGLLNQHGEKLQVQHRVDAACADTPAHPALRRDWRATLARGLLPDPVRSA